MLEWLFLAQAPNQPSTLMALMPMVLIFGVFYVIWFLPIRKKQKALDALLENLSKGDKVITNGGFHGEVVKIDGEIVTLELAENVKVRIARRAIAGLAGEPNENGGK